tara:strand:+ start:534 stop:1220 length:687 start_codon:yes stop_codon:yes gene_type:complete
MYTPGVRIIIWMCAIFYLLQHLYYPLVSEIFGLAYIGHPNFNSLQLLTYTFLHGDAFHIFINMFMLAIFGPRIEQSVGIQNLFVLFVLSSIGGAVAQTMFTMFSVYNAFGTLFPIAPLDFYEQVQFSLTYGREALELFSRITIGASAGVFGVMLAFTCMFPTQRLGLPLLNITLSARLIVIIYVVGEIYMAIYDPTPDIAHYAHIGGAIVGLLLALYWRNSLKSKNNA